EGWRQKTEGWRQKTEGWRLEAEDRRLEAVLEREGELKERMFVKTFAIVRKSELQEASVTVLRFVTGILAFSISFSGSPFT
ncbi:MAG: hypothetical protein HC903_29585, partial [Methylacidiphilales bacterium]|nr:hypothetical protein [Candidatus Methylacidiphilales bacterium]